jgi:predicted nucleic acid-binding protein
MIVADANLIGNLSLNSQDSPFAIQAFEKDPDWYAPLLWQSEVRSILTGYIRHHLLTFEHATQIMEEAHKLMEQHERFISASVALELVVASKCTSYDCENVALAREMNLTLITFDKQIVGAFPRPAIFPQAFMST